MPRRRLPDALRDRAGLAGRRRARCSTSTGAEVGEHAGAAAYTVGQRGGLGVAPSASRATWRASMPPRTSSTLGRREDLVPRRVRPERRARSSRPATLPPTTFRAAVRIRHRAAPVPATVSPAGDRALGRRRSSSRSGRRRPARPPSCTTATTSSVAAGSPTRRDRGACSFRARVALAPARVSLRPALVLAVLVGTFHSALYVLIRGSAGGRLPCSSPAAILGAWAGDALADRIGLDLI